MRYIATTAGRKRERKRERDREREREREKERERQGERGMRFSIERKEREGLEKPAITTKKKDGKEKKTSTSILGARRKRTGTYTRLQEEQERIRLCHRQHLPANESYSPFLKCGWWICGLYIYVCACV
jgi:trehalose/maltose hydrolase-like predicted phosphorylase